MTEAVSRARGLWVPLAVGIYAAALALVPDPAARLALAAPVALAGLGWWVLTGPADRWLIVFLCAAVLLPPLPVALGDSGPHPSLLLAALGLAAGALCLAGWRVPGGALAR